MHIFVTGGAGFIGSNFVRMLAASRPECRITNFDLLTYAGNLANLEGIAESKSYRFVKGDVAERESLAAALGADLPDAIVHFAAESHVDRSLLDSGIFVRTNVLGTLNILECARHYGISKIVHVSTDEVYGSLSDMDAPPFSESSPLNPRNPYSASKAGADHLAKAFFVSHGTPVVVTRSGNNYGPYQFPEKLIPLFITNLFEGKNVPLYGDGKNVRDWIHVSDHCRALLAVLDSGRPGEVYNIGPGAGGQVSNLEIARKILAALGYSEEMIKFVPDRPGHDFRYALDTSKIYSELGFAPSIGLDEGIADTVEWYRKNEAWWKAVRSGEYREYYAKMYPAL
ncbi:MAG: dTDP-glucose 4,6-dehydratase [bacterium]|jgi:dTDP-glucose 4,6-dehydratase